MHKVTVALILNGTKYLEQSLPTLFNQDHNDIEYLLLDQEEGIWSASEFIQKQFPQIAEKAVMMKGPNLMHGGGMNKLAEMMTGDFLLMVSNDMLYPRDLVSSMVRGMMRNPEYGFSTCKSKYWDYRNNKITNRIDSFGLGITKAHRFFEIGQGEEDEGQYDDVKDIFGSSAALMMISKPAIELIKYKNELFDEMLHYKNDSELSYRLQWRGIKGFVNHDVTVYHDRQIDKFKEKPLWVIVNSYRGDRVTLLKNYSSDFPWTVKILTLLYSNLKGLYLAFRYPQIREENRRLRQSLPDIFAKKVAMNRTVAADDIVSMMK